MGVTGSDGPTHEPATTEVVREAITMALYVALSLLAVMVAVPKYQLGDGGSAALIVALTSLGLILAHVVAFRISSQFVHYGLLTPEAVRLIGAQFAGGLAVTVVACIPLLVLEGVRALQVAEIALLLVVTGVAYAASRRAGTSRLRAIVHVSGVVVAIAVVLIVKNVVAH
jgi:hypothetical protein